MFVEQLLLLARLIASSLPASLSEEPETEFQPIRRTQYGLLRGIRLKTPAWSGEIESETDFGNFPDSRFPPTPPPPVAGETSTDRSEWKAVLERGLGPAQGGLEAEAYLGIQYASVLNGHLRFMPPTGPTESWHGRPRSATEYRPVCPQPGPWEMERRSKTAEEADKWRDIGRYLEEQEEECLFLNVYVPAARRRRKCQVV